jgi:hypothetical protein
VGGQRGWQVMAGGCCMTEEAAGRPAWHLLHTCTNAVLACWHCICPAPPFPSAAGGGQQQRHQASCSHQQPELPAPASDPAAEHRLWRCGVHRQGVLPRVCCRVGPSRDESGAHAWRPVRTCRGALCTLVWPPPASPIGLTCLPHLPTTPLLAGCAGGANAAAVSPDGRHVAVAGKDGVLRVYAYPSGGLMAGFKSYYGGLLCCCWSPDGRYVAAGGEDDMLALYGLTGRCTACCVLCAACYVLCAGSCVLCAAACALARWRHGQMHAASHSPHRWT